MSITSASPRLSAKDWLEANGYDDLVATIERIEGWWSERGVATRRDWFLMFAGTPSGKPRVVEGLVLPMVQAFRRRQGYPLAKAAIQRSPFEVAPPIRKQEARWGKKFRRAVR